MRRLLACGTLLIAATALTACGGPNRDDVAEMFSIELAGAHDIGTPETWAEVGAGLADAALDGYCGEETYRIALGEENLMFAWDSGCLREFEGDLSEEERDRIIQAVADRAIDGVLNDE